jgi:aromatic-L-amino-acid/L-tryptophan decarboxylase
MERHAPSAAEVLLEETPTSLPTSGDMPPDEFRRHAHAVVDWIADYLDRVDSLPVRSRARPGDLARSLPSDAPEEPEAFEAVLRDFEAKIVPGITHWNHPGFFAYFGITGSGPGILGETLAAALNVNAMLWGTSPAATELEERTLSWLRQMLGLPGVFAGHIQDTASTSTMVALAAAREVAGIDVRQRGLAGRSLQPLRLYCSEEAHSSIGKAAITLGIGLDGLRRIPTDDAFRLDPNVLEAAIRADLDAGYRPFCIVATIGTTSSTSVDPIERIAEICARHDLWLHVDAAYGGAAAVVPEFRHLMAGWERADSIVINPHKWLFVPIDCSALFVRDPDTVRRTFSLAADYLETVEAANVTNLMEYGPALGRRFRALKLWMTLRYFGRVGLADRIREHVRLSHRFAEWVGAADEWEVVAPVPFSTVCFRHRGANGSDDVADRLNQHILDRVNDSGEVFLSHTRLAGRLVLRLAVGNLRTEEHHVARAWDLLREAAEREA